MTDIAFFLFIRFCSFSAVSGLAQTAQERGVVGLVSGVEGDLPGNDCDDYTTREQRRSVRQHTKPNEAKNERQITQTA